jgi:hypothetical protein
MSLYSRARALLVQEFLNEAPQTKAATEPVREGQGVTTALSGNASAVTYWVSEPDGWHVVTTVDTVTGQFDEAKDHALLVSIATGTISVDLGAACHPGAAEGRAHPSPQ